MWENRTPGGWKLECRRGSSFPGDVSVEVEATGMMGHVGVWQQIDPRDRSGQPVCPVCTGCRKYAKYNILPRYVSTMQANYKFPLVHGDGSVFNMPFQPEKCTFFPFRPPENPRQRVSDLWKYLVEIKVERQTSLRHLSGPNIHWRAKWGQGQVAGVKQDYSIHTNHRWIEGRKTKKKRGKMNELQPHAVQIHSIALDLRKVGY